MTKHPWENSYPPGLSWNAELPAPTPLQNILGNAAAQWQERPLIDFYDRVLSYSEVHTLAKRAAAGLQALGVGPGSSVGLYLPNTPHYAICFYAALMAGGRVVNFGPLTGPREFARQVADSNIRVMITTDMTSYYPPIAAIVGKDCLETLVICSLEDFLDSQKAATLARKAAPIATPGRQIRFQDLIDNAGEVETHPLPDLQSEVAVIQYTGGTSGEPKGAALTHANFSAVLDLSARVSAAFFGGMKVPPIKLLIAMPICHITGLMSGVIAPLASGSQIVLHLRFNAEQVLTDIERKRVMGFFAVPSMYAALLSHPTLKDRDLSSLKGWSVGGAPMPNDLARRFQERTATAFHEGYGLTETASYATFQFAMTARPRSAGLPSPRTNIEIVDTETGLQVLPLGQAGEICISGPQVMKEYWNAPEITAHAFRGGRFHTGDIGVMSEDGYLTVLERKKDMILTGGFNVYPSRIENVINEHPLVSEVAVIGIPHAHFGQVAKAFVVLRNEDDKLTHAQLLEFLADKLSRFEMPLALEVRRELPKTPIGKPFKQALVDESLAAAAPARVSAV